MRLPQVEYWRSQIEGRVAKACLEGGAPIDPGSGYLWCLASHLPGHVVRGPRALAGARALKGQPVVIVSERYQNSAWGFSGVLDGIASDSSGDDIVMTLSDLSCMLFVPHSRSDSPILWEFEGGLV